MAEMGNSSSKAQDGMRNFKSIYREEGLVGLVKGAPGSLGGKVTEIMYGKKNPIAPNPNIPRHKFIDVSDTGNVADENGRTIDPKNREEKRPEYDEVYKAMYAFWEKHIEKISTLRKQEPGLFADKSSYLYYQWIQVRRFLTDAGAHAVGQFDPGKLRAYFQNENGYSETMRYMESEAFRIECANDIVEMTRNGYKPDGLQTTNLGVVTGWDRAAAVARYGAGVAATIETLIITTGIMRNLNLLVPSIQAVFPVAAPLLVGIAAASIPWNMTVQKVEEILKSNTPESIMLQCNEMIRVLQGSPNYASARRYLRGVYSIDPGELRFTTTGALVFDSGGITTTGWPASKQKLLGIKDTRRMFYNKVLHIEDHDMFGMVEEAFVGMGQLNNKDTPFYRNQTIPEQHPVQYEQAVWTRFYDMGGHYDTDGKTRLDAVSAIRRFQEARMAVIMEGIEEGARDILEGDRTRDLNTYDAIIKQRKRAVAEDGITRETEVKPLKDIVSLSTELNDGVDGKPALKEYVQEWKGTGATSIESRLGELGKVRQDVYKEVAAVVSYTEPIEEITEAHIDGAIQRLEESIDPEKAHTGEPGKRLQDIDTALIPVLPKIDSGSRDSKSNPIMVDNPHYVALTQDRGTVIEEIKKVKEKIQEMKDLKVRLGNERAKYDPRNEHGRVFGETLRKMEDAYKQLSDAAPRRNPAIAVPAGLDTILNAYPGNFEVMDMQSVKVTRQGMAGLMATLANETLLWDEQENTIHERKMMMIYAVAFARAKTKISAIDKLDTGTKAYSTKLPMKDFWAQGVAAGKFTEMTVLAYNATELSGMGMVNGVNMNTGDNVGLKTYARARYDAYTTAIEEVMRAHELNKQAAEKLIQRAKDKFDTQGERLTTVEGIITQEKGDGASSQEKKVRAQVFMRNLTGSNAVLTLTDLRGYAARTQAEQDAYSDYEAAFLRAQINFPPSMLEFLDVVFGYRSDPDGKKKLLAVIDLLKDTSGIQEPSMVLADMIYEATPGIKNLLRVTKREVNNGRNLAGQVLNPPFRWDQLVLTAFRLRQEGVIPPIGANFIMYFLPSVRRPYSASEMTNILVSIQDQVIRKAVKHGVI